MVRSTFVNRLRAVGSAALHLARHRLARQPLPEGRRGSVALEFAMVMPPFLMLCFGFIGVNAALFTRSAMQNSSQIAARMMATGQIKNFASGAISAANSTSTTGCASSPGSTTVEYYACLGLPTWATFTVTATQNCAVPSVTVSVQAATFNSAATGDRMNVLLGKTLTAQTVMMKEGTCP